VEDADSHEQMLDELHLKADKLGTSYKIDYARAVAELESMQIDEERYFARSGSPRRQYSSDDREDKPQGSTEDIAKSQKAAMGCYR
jgi:hypothetical protein